MYYPTMHHVETIIHDIGKTQNTKLVITNRGQLEFALEKPKMIIYGSEQYPELYQKAAILMETITKAHVLSDGNKRTAMLVAQLMINANGGRLILPIKSIRLSVDTAMDNDDAMSDIIQQWFKVHTAMNACNLAAMLAELDEEEEVIKAMLRQNKGDDANSLLDRWMVFDSYPENRQVADELIREWEKREKASAVKHTTTQHTDDWPPIWDSFMTSKSLLHAQREHRTDHSGDVRKLKYNYNSMAELQAAEEQILKESAKCEEAKDASLVHQNALRLERYGMYDDAIDMFNELRTLNRNEFHAVFHVAIITQYKLNDPESAIKHWNTCMKYNPDDPLVHLCMGDALVELGQYSSARDCLKKIKHGDLNHPEINIHMGQIYDRMHEYSMAVKCYEREILDNPNSSEVYGFMGTTYSHMGNQEKAMECSDMIIRIEPDNPKGYYSKGALLSDSGKYEEAITFYRKALEINPVHLRSKINMASAISNSGRPEEALPYFYSVLELRPDHPIALRGMAVTLVRMNRTDEALVHADKLIETAVSDVSAKYLKASILADMGRFDECLALLEMLADTDSNFKKFMHLNISKGAFNTLLNDKRFKNLIGNQDHLQDDSG